MPDNFLFWKGVSAFRAGGKLHVIGGRLVILFEFDILPQHDVGQFHCVKAGQFEIGSQLFQVRQFQAQQFFIPSAVQGELIVGNLCCAQHKSPYVVFAVMWRSLTNLHGSNGLVFRNAT
jgi:hypothetical protein